MINLTLNNTPAGKQKFVKQNKNNSTSPIVLGDSPSPSKYRSSRSSYVKVKKENTTERARQSPDRFRPKTIRGLATSERERSTERAPQSPDKYIAEVAKAAISFPISYERMLELSVSAANHRILAIELFQEYFKAEIDEGTILDGEHNVSGRAFNGGKPKKPINSDKMAVIKKFIINNKLPAGMSAEVAWSQCMTTINKKLSSLRKENGTEDN